MNTWFLDSELSTCLVMNPCSREFLLMSVYIYNYNGSRLLKNGKHSFVANLIYYCAKI